MSKIKFFEKIYSTFLEYDLPVDLILVLIWVAANIIAIYLTILNATWVRLVLSFPTMLFIPGYCLTAALFPKKSDINLLERIALSIGLSIAVVPLIGFVLNFTTWGIRLNPIVISLTFFTLLMVFIAAYRRALLPIGERFRIPFSEIVSAIRQEIFPTESNRGERILIAALILAILIAIMTTIFVINFPRESGQFTEFFILGENRTTTYYPDLIIPGQNYPMFIGVGNHEYRNMNYTIETWMIRMEFDNVTNSSAISVMDPGEWLVIPLAHNETTIIPYNLSVKRTGYNRVEFLLFENNVPGLEVTGGNRINASYRNLHLGITVEERLDQVNRDESL